MTFFNFRIYQEHEHGNEWYLQDASTTESPGIAYLFTAAEARAFIVEYQLDESRLRVSYTSLEKHNSNGKYGLVECDSAAQAFLRSHWHYRRCESTGKAIALLDSDAYSPESGDFSWVEYTEPKVKGKIRDATASPNYYRNTNIAKTKAAQQQAALGRTIAAQGKLAVATAKAVLL